MLHVWRSTATETKISAAVEVIPIEDCFFLRPDSVTGWTGAGNWGLFYDLGDLTDRISFLPSLSFAVFFGCWGRGWCQNAKK